MWVDSCHGGQQRQQPPSSCHRLAAIPTIAIGLRGRIFLASSQRISPRQDTPTCFFFSLLKIEWCLIKGRAATFTSVRIGLARAPDDSQIDSVRNTLVQVVTLVKPTPFLGQARGFVGRRKRGKRFGIVSRKLNTEEERAVPRPREQKNREMNNVDGIGVRDKVCRRR